MGFRFSPSARVQISVTNCSMKRKVYRSSRKVSGGRYSKMTNFKSYQKKRIGIPVKIGQPKFTSREVPCGKSTLFHNMIFVSCPSPSGDSWLVTHRQIQSVLENRANKVFKSQSVINLGAKVSLVGGGAAVITSRAGRGGAIFGKIVEDL